MALMALTGKYQRNGRQVLTPSHRGLELFTPVACVVPVGN